MTTPDPARQAAYEAAARALYRAHTNYEPNFDDDRAREEAVDGDDWCLECHGTSIAALRAARVALDAVWDLAVEEGRRQSRALDPEVAEVVADTIERWEGDRNV